MSESMNQMVRGTLHQRSRAKKQLTLLAKAEALYQGCPVFPDQVWISIDYHVRNSRSDWDNWEAVRKFLLDGLKAAGVIVDDCLLFVRFEQSRFFVDVPKGGEQYAIVRIANHGPQLVFFGVDDEAA